MVLLQICGRIKLVFLIIIGAFRRALCCFSRKRKPSFSDCEKLESVNVVINYNDKQNMREKDWNRWDDTPQTIEEHIESYRQRLVRPPTPKESEPEQNFFEDMAPVIKPQQKVYVATGNQKTDNSRLELKHDIPMAVVADLEDWIEEDPAGWEELDTEQTKQIIREKRREIRAQRQTKSKDGIKLPTVNFAEKISPKHS